MLRKAFIRVAQNPYVISDWKRFGRRFNLSAEELDDVARQSSGVRDTCFKVLLTWSEKNPDDGVEALAKQLRKAKYNHAASK